MDYYDRLKHIVSQKKPNENLKVPKFLKNIYKPFFLYHMKRNIKKDFSKKNTYDVLNSYPKTLESAAEFSMYLYCLNASERYIYRDLLKNIEDKKFNKILEKYGDTFSSQILTDIREDIITEQDIVEAKDRLSNISQMYLHEQNYSLFQSIRQNYGTTENLDHYIIGSCNRLATDARMFNKYTDFFQKVQQKEELILPVLQTTYFLTKHLGTYKVYDNFLQLCEKLKDQKLLPEVIHTLKVLAQYGSPEIFYEATEWGCKTSMDNRLVSQIYKHSIILLDEETKSTFSAYCFSKFIKYLKDKEQKFSEMKNEDLEYYVEKAVEFFVEL